MMFGPSTVGLSAWSHRWALRCLPLLANSVMRRFHTLGAVASTRRLPSLAATGTVADQSARIGPEPFVVADPLVATGTARSYSTTPPVLESVASGGSTIDASKEATAAGTTAAAAVDTLLAKLPAGTDHDIHLTAAQTLQVIQVHEAIRRGPTPGGEAPLRLCLIDVRTSLEIVASGTLPSAYTIPLNDLPTFLPGDTPPTSARPAVDPEHTALVFFCQAGVRSAQAVTFAQSLGFKKCFHVPGGFGKWKGPVEFRE